MFLFYLGREESEPRSILLKQLSDLKQEYEQQTLKLDQFADCDPELYALKVQHTKVAKNAANRWTENIFCLQSYGISDIIN
jgi:hypothetical protein